MSDIAYRILRARHLQEYMEFLEKVDLDNDGQLREVIQSMALYGVDRSKLPSPWNLSQAVAARWMSAGKLGRDVLLQAIRAQVFAGVAELVNQD